MQAMERLLPDLDRQDEGGYSTRFWLAFSLFIIIVASLSLFAFFYYVVMLH